jgi:hypothetical protein
MLLQLTPHQQYIVPFQTYYMPLLFFFSYAFALCSRFKILSVSTTGYPYFNLLLVYSRLTTWRCALLQKPPIVQLLNNFPTFYGTRKFITVFIRDKWSLF